MERNEENEMLKLSEIDVNKCFIDDTVGFWDGFWERRNGLGAARYMLTLIVQAKH